MGGHWSARPKDVGEYLGTFGTPVEAARAFSQHMLDKARDAAKAPPMLAPAPPPRSTPPRHAQQPKQPGQAAAAVSDSRSRAHAGDARRRAAAAAATPSAASDGAPLRCSSSRRRSQRRFPVAMPHGAPAPTWLWRGIGREGFSAVGGEGLARPGSLPQSPRRRGDVGRGESSEGDGEGGRSEVALSEQWGAHRRSGGACARARGGARAHPRRWPTRARPRALAGPRKDARSGCASRAPPPTAAARGCARRPARAPRAETAGRAAVRAATPPSSGMPDSPADFEGASAASRAEAMAPTALNQRAFRSPRRPAATLPRHPRPGPAALSGRRAAWPLTARGFRPAGPRLHPSARGAAVRLRRRRRRRRRRGARGDGRGGRRRPRRLHARRGARPACCAHAHARTPSFACDPGPPHAARASHYRSRRRGFPRAPTPPN